ncbi:MAG: hypothetical protein HUU55_05605 [Myxococcales bacterium]|nr:hypothetical protein [Myxococcales bacterium]
MSTTISMILGIAFTLLGIAAVILQAWLWKFPMVPDPGGPDPNGKSTAPRSWTQVHRLIGAAYVLIYLIMMWEMIPRLWQYQVELPARTVMHAVMGITIGVLLVVKVSIIRWFQHFGKSLPTLGVALLLCTLILATLSIPFAIRAHDFGGQTFSASNLARVEKILFELGGIQGKSAKELVEKPSLDAGRDVLVHKCTWCHDMRTILIKPRTGSQWLDLVERMAEKPVIGEPMDPPEIAYVTAYLIAITPEIQQSARSKAAVEAKSQEIRIAVAELTPTPVIPDAEPTTATFDIEAAKSLYEQQCVQCHELDTVADYGPQTETEWVKIVKRMVDDEGAELNAEQAKTIVSYLTKTQGKKE